MQQWLRRVLLVTICSLASTVALANSAQTKNQNHHKHFKELAAAVVQITLPEVDAKIRPDNTTEVYMDVSNRGQKEHDLVAASSPVAKQVQLHRFVVKQGHHEMVPISKIPVYQHELTHLQPGGFHVMLIGLKQHLIVGGHVPILLIFADGSWQQVYAKV